MTTPVADQRQTPAPQAHRRRRRFFWIVVGIAGLLVGLVALVLGDLAFTHSREGRPLPAFPSLAEHPNRALHGTVAYYATDTGCVRLIAASGQSSKTVWCLPKEGVETWVKVGKPVGPQLVWLPDGRLEVTVFRMLPKPGNEKTAPALTPGWQKVIDVRTGAVQDVPTANLPAAPISPSGPAVNARGERVGWTENAGTGQVQVTLTTGSGTRTLLSAHGPGEYGYQFGPVFWAPNGQWIAAADNGRILVIVPSEPATTHVLVTGAGGGAGGGTAGPTFAVTAADLLIPS